MSNTVPPPAIVCGLASGLFLWLSLYLRRKHRLLADLPTSKARGVFIGLVELKGTAESSAPLRSFLAEADCVHFAYEVAESWSRTVTETYTDKDGRTQTRTRTESGWRTIADGSRTQDFFVRDETGAVLVRPEGARIDATTIFSETVGPGDALYYAKGPQHAVADSTHRRRFIEHAIPLHAALFVVGQARERDDIVAPEIAQASDAPLFLISMRTEESVQTRRAVASWCAWAAGLVAAVAVPFIIAGGPLDTIAPLALSTGAFLAIWSTGWVWMVFNSLIGLRQRVRQAWSLVDVQLKRRHDLIPSLAAAVAALGSHEQAVQAGLAALRAQLDATAPGVAGPDFEGVANRVRAIVERYPALVAQPGFAQLHEQLVETEQRIALARSYYNDIATHFATRLERVPERWVAALAAMRPEPLLVAENFERAPVVVEFAREATAAAPA